MDSKIQIKPEKSLFDKPFEITISNVIPQSTVRVDCLLKDDKGNPWYKSYATYKANDMGIVNIAKDAPIEGSYTGVDAMGLIWSMEPVDKTEKHDSINGNENEVFFKVSIEDKVVLEKSEVRDYSTSNLEKKFIQEEGLIGYFCYPKGRTN